MEGATKFFHKAPKVIPDKTPAQQVGIVVEGINSVIALPRALNLMYSLFMEKFSKIDEAMEDPDGFEWYEAD